MTYLERRADRFRRNGRWHKEEMEEIIVELEEGMGDRCNDGGLEGDAKMAEHAAVWEAITEGLLQPHGTPPNTKQDGIFRILCENLNGFTNQITGNHKLDKAIDIKDELDMDMLLYSEHPLNLRHKENKNNFKQMFQWEVACQAVTSHNVHHGVSRVQEGGTGMVAFGDTTRYILKVGKDTYGLGRWSWMLYSNNDGHHTRVIVAYSACKNNKKDSRTTYQQQRQFFITQHHVVTCPNKLFRVHLLDQLAKWLMALDRIIIFIDHNKHTYNGPLGQALANTSGLALQKVVLQHTGKRTGTIFFQGSKLIDRLWVSSNIKLVNACVMPFGYGVDNHRMFVLNITLELLIAKRPTKIVCPALGRLNSKIPHCTAAYNKSLKDNIVQHHLIKRLHEVHMSNLGQQEKTKRVCAIDRAGKEFMKHAEKVCRKIKSCRIPFSPEALIWIRCTQVYYSLLKLHKGKIRNKGNLKRVAGRCNILNPLGLLIPKILLRVEECKCECQFYLEHGKQFKARHLNQHLRLAQEEGDKEAVEKIAALIQQEKQRAFWQRLIFVTGKKRTRSTTSIQVLSPLGLVNESEHAETSGGCDILQGTWVTLHTR
jgi:hypothetical protein